MRNSSHSARLSRPKPNITDFEYDQPETSGSLKGFADADSSGFIETLGGAALEHAVAAFGMTKGQLAETAGLSADTARRIARSSSPKSQRRMAEMLEIVSRVATWAGGEKQAMAWYRATPIPAFGDRTAESLVKDGKAGALRDYLDHLAMGGFA